MDKKRRKPPLQATEKAGMGFQLLSAGWGEAGIPVKRLFLEGEA